MFEKSGMRILLAIPALGLATGCASYGPPGYGPYDRFGVYDTDIDYDADYDPYITQEEWEGRYGVWYGPEGKRYYYEYDLDMYELYDDSFSVGHDEDSAYGW